jgi:hypothetical protein
MLAALSLCRTNAQLRYSAMIFMTTIKTEAEYFVMLIMGRYVDVYRAYVTIIVATTFKRVSYARTVNKKK